MARSRLADPALDPAGSHNPSDPEARVDLAPTTDLATMPLILTLEDMTRIYRVSTWTIRRDLANGTFRPLPWAEFPYRWNREDVADDLRRRRAYAIRPAPLRAPLAAKLPRRGRPRKVDPDTGEPPTGAA